ncbi:MAG: DUF2067 family protein [Candidatus Heimdallarchaeaceae archaeon]
MAKGTVKDISINIHRKDQLDSFIRLVSDSLSNVEFFLQYKLGSVKVRIFGEKDVVNDAVFKLKTLSKMFLDSYRANEKGFYSHHLHFLQKVTSKIISLELIKSVLEHTGHQTSIRNLQLITTASLDEVTSVLDHSYDLVRSFPNTVKGQALRKIILTVSYVTEFDPDFVLEQGVKRGYLKEYQNKVLVTQDPDTCMKDLISELTQESVQKEYLDYKQKGKELFLGGNIDWIDSSNEDTE